MTCPPPSLARIDQQSPAKETEEVEVIFFLECVPPTVTAQMMRISRARRKDGRAIVYKDQKLLEARALFMELLSQHVPEAPLRGPVSLAVDWYFPTTKADRHHAWKTTKPDTDNMLKLFKDCMTKAGFWKDDAQVCHEETRKKWTCTSPGVLVEVEEIHDKPVKVPRI